MSRRSSPSVFPDPPPFVPPGRASALNALHGVRLAEIEASRGPVFAYAGQYPDGYTVPAHRHRHAQLLEAAKGVVMVSTELGRWLVPPDHALWLPPGLAHAVEMLGVVTMHSVYVAEAAAETLPRQVRVVGLTALMQSLIAEALASPRAVAPDARARLINALILAEIARLPLRPLGLPMPREPRLAKLCRAFVAAPDPHLTIEDWAEALAMSRRAFTRAFRAATGLSLSVWRQQACLFTAVPRLADGEPVTSVALDLGYDSAAAFTTMFTRMLGASPRAYFGKGGA
jgi:AraC-like DNA-binding protein